MCTFGKRLKELREENNMTGEELGKKLNVSKVAISNWENENRSPDINMLIKIANIFNCSTDYLLGRAKNKQGLIVEVDAPQGHVRMEVDKNIYPNGLTYEEVLEKLEAIRKLEEAGFIIAPKKENKK